MTGSAARLRTAALIVTALMLAACAGGVEPRFPDGGDSDPGAYPTAYKAELLAFMQTYLNDPTNVRDALIADPVLRPLGRASRYMVCVRYNARNSDGRYIGITEGAAIYLRGRFTQLVDTAAAGVQLCKDASYNPFPELERLKRR